MIRPTLRLSPASPSGSSLGSAARPCRARVTAIGAALAALAVACVTVNVNFPEGAVQKASDDYVRDLYRAKEKGKSPAVPSASPKAVSLRESGFADWAMWNLVPEATAAPAVRVDGAQALAIKTRLRGRVDQVIQEKKSGVLGETNDGRLEVRAPDQVKPLLRQKIAQLVKAENDDRAELYADVLKTNGIPKDHEKDVRKSFAHSFQAESPSSTWVQDDAGAWSQKP